MPLATLVGLNALDGLSNRKMHYFCCSCGISCSGCKQWQERKALQWRLCIPSLLKPFGKDTHSVFPVITGLLQPDTNRNSALIFGMRPFKINRNLRWTEWGSDQNLWQSNQWVWGVQLLLYVRCECINGLRCEVAAARAHFKRTECALTLHNAWKQNKTEILF